MQEKICTDHEFSAWLRSKDENWESRPCIREDVVCFYCRGEMVALVIYDNKKCTRRVFVN